MQICFWTKNANHTLQLQVGDYITILKNYRESHWVKRKERNFLSEMLQSTSPSLVNTKMANPVVLPLFLLLPLQSYMLLRHSQSDNQKFTSKQEKEQKKKKRLYRQILLFLKTSVRKEKDTTPSNTIFSILHCHQLFRPVHGNAYFHCRPYQS